MHELSIAQNIMKIVASSAQRSGATSVKTIRVRAGALRGIVPEQLLFLFDFVKKETIAEDATLEVEIVPVKAECKDCQRMFLVQNFEMICPECQSKDLSVISGMELDVKEIEIV
jgi:hydrogenase nickel incorporation protein HypA/HybF